MSKTSEDLPDPETPVTATSRPSGRRTVMFWRLCSRAPWMVEGVAAWRAAALRGIGMDGPPGQIVAGERSGLPGHLRRRAGGDHLPAMLARAGAEVDHVVGGGDHIQVVFDDEDGVAQVAQAAQDADQAVGVALVQPDGRLVEDVEHAAQPGAEQRRQPQALRLAGGEATAKPRSSVR